MNKINIPNLTSNESLVYVTLLNLKEAGATEIAKECGLFRTFVYDILTKLADKGLVTYIIKSGKKRYRTSSPDKLLNLIKEKENLTRNILPELNILFQKPKEECLVEQYEGVNGAKTVIDEAFQEAISRKFKEFLFFGATGKAVESIGYYYMHMVELAEKRKLPYKVDFRGIWSSKLITMEVIKSIGKKKNHRFFPDGYEPTAPAIIYGDKVVLIGGIHKPFTILIKNKQLADSFKYYFEFMWKYASKYKK